MISVTILVKNGERHLKKVLSALQNFEEIVLLDTGSEDQTLAIAKTFANVKIFESPFLGFGPCHNLAAEYASHDWILSIDADEVLSDGLSKEILSFPLDPNQVYALSFQNYFNGKHIRWCGWHPETHIRLYNRKTTSFSDAMVHEGVDKKNLKEITFRQPLYHYSYETLSDFLVKMERYSSLFAAQNKHKRKSSPLLALWHGLGAFTKSFFLKRGFLGGFEGFVISFYNAHTAFYKYLKLYLANKEK